jgi:dimethylargininase
MALIALTRDVSPAINECQLTHLDRTPIDPVQAEAQHGAYERCLAELGCRVERIEATPYLPDGVFVEDTVVVVDELAVITRPGVESRLAETFTMAQAVERHRTLAWIEAPGTLDGGDVLRIDRTLFVGAGQRSNAEGIAQLQRFLEPYHYEVVPVTTGDCLHLKTAITQVADGTLLINPEWIDPSIFAGFQLIECDPGEPFGANALRVGESVLYASAWRRTRERLEHHGIRVVTVDASELAKAEAGVTCCSVVFPG